MFALRDTPHRLDERFPGLHLLSQRLSAHTRHAEQILCRQVSQVKPTPPRQERRQETGDRRQETGDRRQETGDRTPIARYRAIHRLPFREPGRFRRPMVPTTTQEHPPVAAHQSSAHPPRGDAPQGVSRALGSFPGRSGEADGHSLSASQRYCQGTPGGERRYGPPVRGADALGRADSWLTLQAKWDLWHALRVRGRRPKVKALPRAWRPTRRAEALHPLKGSPSPFLRAVNVVLYGVVRCLRPLRYL